MPTAFEIAQGRPAPLTEGIFEAVQTRHPLFSHFDTRTSAEDKFLSLARVSLPSSSFANLGEGFSSSTAKFSLREFSCSLIGGKVEAELISMRKWDRNHPGNGYFAIQLESKMTADILHVERQIIRGLENDAKGFPGAKDMTPFVTAALLTAAQTPDDYDFEKTVLNVAGSTASTASSVYSFVFGEMEAQLVLGNDGGAELFAVSEPMDQHIAPDPNQPDKTLLHRLVQIEGWVGLSIGGFNQQQQGQEVPTQYSVRRAANVTGDADKGCTDSVMEKLGLMHGTGRFPNLFAMSGRSGDQLAKSRSATEVFISLGGGGDARTRSASIQPKRPDNWEGVPIVYPQPGVIPNNDAIEVAA